MQASYERVAQHRSPLVGRGWVVLANGWLHTTVTLLTLLVSLGTVGLLQGGMRKAKMRGGGGGFYAA